MQAQIGASPSSKPRGSLQRVAFRCIEKKRTELMQPRQVPMTPENFPVSWLPCSPGSANLVRCRLAFGTTSVCQPGARPVMIRMHLLRWRGRTPGRQGQSLATSRWSRRAVMWQNRSPVNTVLVTSFVRPWPRSGSCGLGRGSARCDLPISFAQVHERGFTGVASLVTGRGCPFKRFKMSQVSSDWAISCFPGNS